MTSLLLFSVGDSLPSSSLSISPVVLSILLSLSFLDPPPLYSLLLICCLTTQIWLLLQIGAAHHKRLWVVCTDISWSFSNAESFRRTISLSTSLLYTFQDRAPPISCTSTRSSLQIVEWFRPSSVTTDRNPAGSYLWSNLYHIASPEL